jgi:hypothetical protein
MNALTLLLVLAAPFEDGHIVEVAPSGQNDRAVLKGRAPWCTGTFDGATDWDEGRLSRSVKTNSFGRGLNSNWPETANQLCQFPDEPTWQKQALGLLQCVMNENNLTQAKAEAFIVKGIEKYKKDKANEGQPESDEDRFAFAERQLVLPAPAAGVDTAKLTDKPAWCDVVPAFEPDERWTTGRIGRTFESTDSRGLTEAATPRGSSSRRSSSSAG